MQELFLYLLKSSGLIAAFFLSYHFLLRKETFFTANRWFLLSGLITSVLLPLFFIKKIVFIERPRIDIGNLNVVTNGTSNAAVAPIAETTDWIQLLAIGYTTVVLFLLLKIIFNVISLFKLLSNKKIEKHQSFVFVDLQQNIAPFSFFNYIVFNSGMYSKNELDSILLHEKVHSRQKHSYDVLIVKLFSILFWFNPFIWLYKKAIIQNLEYIADNKAIEHIEDKKVYQKALLKVVTHQNCISITNHFYQSLIKKRIIMLNKNQSRKRNSLKYAAVIPALIAYVFLFQVKVEAKEKYPGRGTAIVKTSTETVLQNYDAGFIFDKITTDDEIKESAEIFKKEYNIDLTYSNLKRNTKGEIIAIKLAFNDNNGKKGVAEQDRKIPIRPIFFRTKASGDGTNGIGFYDNHEMISKPKDMVTENKINTIENINETMLIYVDGEQYTKEDLDYLDPKGLEKIEIHEGKKAVKIYGDKGKNGVAVITTNWTTKTPTPPTPPVTPAAPAAAVQNKIIIFQNDNGDDIVYSPEMNYIKVPQHPAVQLKENSPVLIVNGEEKSNALITLSKMDLKKVKSLRVFDENGNDTAGSAIKKLVITTK